MRMPGFGAEASLYATTDHYWMSGAASPVESRVEPQAAVSDRIATDASAGALGYSNSCRAACRCCANNKNRFCCQHCRWCSWP